jgi:L-threonylcarbamoyladenylate synthase
MSRILAVTDQTIAQAAEVIKNGGLVAMPTETVYGLAANALEGKAVARVYEAKGRPAFNPLISHYSSVEAMQQDVVWNEQAQALADSFWPGPLTMILPRSKTCRISELASAGLPTMAVRVPSHPAAQALLKAVGFPLVAPSANKSGQISPTTPAHVAESLGAAVDIILAGGASKIGLESTVLDLSSSVPTILRPGLVLAEDIARVLDTDVLQDFAEAKDTLKSPGQMLRHYAPNAPLRLNAIDLNPGEALLAFSKTRFMGIKGGGSAADLPEDMIRNLSEEGDLHEAASNLFAMLKDLDRPGQKAIAVMPIPDHGLGIAINDRLKRASVRE